MGEIVGYCDICGKQFLKYRSYNRFCSNDCRKVEYTKNKYGYKRKENVTKTCLACGKQFETNNDKKVYCCEKCYVDHKTTVYTKIAASERMCPICGESFISSHCSKKYCNTACYKQAKKERESKHE